jgi:hypothetical protein
VGFLSPSPTGPAFLRVGAKAQFRCGEKAIDDHGIAAHAVIHELAVASSSDDEERRHFALSDPAGKFDIDLAPVVEGSGWPRGRAVALDLVTEIEIAEIEPDVEGRRGFRDDVLVAQRNEPSCGYSQETEGI